MFASFLSIPFTFNLLPLPLPSILPVLFPSRQVRLVYLFFISPTRLGFRRIHESYASLYTASLLIAATLTDC